MSRRAKPFKHIGTSPLAQAFAETTTGVEMKPDGSGFRVHARFTIG